MEQWGDLDLWGRVVFVLVSVNLLLSGLGKVLEFVTDVIPGDKDKKLSVLLNKAVAFLSKVVDWLGANREHK